MKVLVCLDDPTPADGECATTAWVELPQGIFDGATIADYREMLGPVLYLLAAAFVIRIVIRWAQSDV